MHKLAVTYRGTKLRVESDQYEGRLLINGLIRARIKLTSVIRLTSTVQTDYEWHELIEGTIKQKPGKVTLALYANNTQIARKDFCSQLWSI
ncbi:MAG: hypothetical protein ACJ0Q6_03300 [Candidatus Azotimanducaceae bacterium]|uniref:Uncharacterized protein n=1 Tax=OM182 bacterium TaxID=2510334 RepID=A0A520S4R4_9GAMM|nr:MAG: hypothetical protein EVA68_01045 [OM182 bacterium]